MSDSRIMVEIVIDSEEISVVGTYYPEEPVSGNYPGAPASFEVDSAFYNGAEIPAFACDVIADEHEKKCIEAAKERISDFNTQALVDAA